MKTRIIGGVFKGNYTDSWLLKNKDKIVNGALVSEWELVDTQPSDLFIKAFWDGSIWTDIATQEEIDNFNEGKEDSEAEKENKDKKRNGSDVVYGFKKSVSKEVNKNKITIEQSKTLRTDLHDVLLWLLTGDNDIAKEAVDNKPSYSDDNMNKLLNKLKQDINNIN